MSPELSDDLLGDLWDCDLCEDAARETAAQMQDLLEELVYDLVEGP